MKPCSTINTNKDGELEIWINEAGRDLLVSELQNLSEESDHFHFGPEELDSKAPVQNQAYRAGDQLPRTPGRRSGGVRTRTAGFPPALTAPKCGRDGRGPLQLSA